MTEKLNQANRILDRTCKQAGLDPVAVRIAMINAIKDQLANVGKGYARLPPSVETHGHKAIQ